MLTLTRSIVIAALGLLLSSPTPAPSSSAGGGLADCNLENSNVLQCGGDQSSSGSGHGGGGNGNGIPHEPLEGDCRTLSLTNQPDADDPIWKGNDPGKGVIAEKDCFEKVRIRGVQVVDGLGWTFVGYVYVANGVEVDLPPENPVDLVTEGMKQLPAPAVHYGPFPTRVAVKVPVWLWIDDPGRIVLDVPGVAISIHAVATLTSTTWTTGDP